MNLFLILIFASQLLFAGELIRLDKTNQEEVVSKIVASMENADVLVFGEEHNDSVAHSLELAILKHMSEKYGTSMTLEMLELDQQTILGEFLRGTLTENSFLSSGVFWKNMESDYLPLLQFCRRNSVPVFPANPPRRYVNLVARMGTKAYQMNEDGIRKFMPPLHTVQNNRNKKYEEKFQELMSSGHHGPSFMENYLLAQHIWDATMADSIARAHFETKRKVFHINGRFHSDHRLGVVHRLENFNLKVVTISAFPATKDLNREEAKEISDFVILTDNQ
jgi:uncharacterized iron-regulated protein